jgi:hypothetical protein
VNLMKTSTWQRREILIYRQPYQKRLRDTEIRRWRIEENWNLPSFSSAEGNYLIQRIIDWARPY